jgi:cell wall-associated NlpC family hydrolase
MITDPILLTVSRWVGKTYEEMEALYPSNHRNGWASSYGCWALARAAEALRGNELPEQYHAALDARMFRTVFELQPWDLIPICNHRLPIVTHVMLYLGDSTVIHAIEDSGVVAHPISREKGRRGYLRLRT